MTVSPNEQIEAWFVEYGDDVYRFLVYFLGTLDVEDLLQDTFLRALRSYQRFHGHSSPKTWLLAIARNLAFDSKRRKQTVQVTDDYFLGMESEGQSTESYVADKDSMVRLMESLQALEEKQRTVLILRCIHDLSFKQISQLLGCSEITARSRFHRGKKQAQNILTDLRHGGVLV